MMKKARKQRRGLGLLDVILSLAIVILAIDMVLDYLNAQELRRAERSEAHNLAQARNILGNYVDERALNLAGSLALNTARQISNVDITEAGLTLDPTLLQGIEGRAIDLWVIHEAGNVLTYFARASGALDTPHYPRPDPALGLLGSLTEEDPTRIRGIGVNWLTTGRAGFTPALNDTFAFAQLDIDADIKPYLHRANVTAPDGTNLSQMETDLDLGANSLVNVNDVTLTGDFETTGNIDAQTMTLTGTLSVDDLAVTNSLTIGGDLTTGSFTGAGDGTINGDLSVLGSTTTGQAIVNGPAEFQSLKTDDQFNVGGNTTITGTLAAEDLNIGANLNVGGTLTSDNIIGNSMSISGTLNATNGVISNITTGSCTGC